MMTIVVSSFLVQFIRKNKKSSVVTQLHGNARALSRNATVASKLKNALSIASPAALTFGFDSKKNARRKKQFVFFHYFGIVELLCVGYCKDVLGNNTCTKLEKSLLILG